MARSKQQEPSVVKLLNEIHQGPENRQRLIKKLGTLFNGRSVVTFFTSDYKPVAIDDNDADMIEGILQKTNLQNGLSLIIDSLGGSGLAAERIVNLCRSYSKGNFEVVVPRKAKSAATMIALGASKLWMTKTSELGPIDPQILTRDSAGRFQRLPAHSIVDTYKELLNQAVSTKGNIEPYLQQLQTYDAKEIRNYETAQELSKKIAVEVLKTGMMSACTEDEIEKKIEVFLDPSITSSHGRMVGIDLAQSCSLEIEEIQLDSELWDVLYELYIRTNHYVATMATKVVETDKDHFQRVESV